MSHDSQVEIVMPVLQRVRSSGENATGRAQWKRAMEQAYLQQIETSGESPSDQQKEKNTASLDLEAPDKLEMPAISVTQGHSAAVMSGTNNLQSVISTPFDVSGPTTLLEVSSRNRYPASGGMPIINDATTSRSFSFEAANTAELSKGIKSQLLRVYPFDEQHFSVTVKASEHGMEIWVRDKDFNGDLRKRIIDTLRSYLQSHGAKLARLSINGKLAWVDPCFADRLSDTDIGDGINRIF